MSAELLHAVSLVSSAPSCGGDPDEVPGRCAAVCGDHDDHVGDLVDCAATSVCSDLIAALVEAGAHDDMV